jgi:hypothetical protein
VKFAENKQFSAGQREIGVWDWDVAASILGGIVLSQILGMDTMARGEFGDARLNVHQEINNPFKPI